MYLSAPTGLQFPGNTSRPPGGAYTFAMNFGADLLLSAILVELVLDGCRPGGGETVDGTADGTADTAYILLTDKADIANEQFGGLPGGTGSWQ